MQNECKLFNKSMPRSAVFGYPKDKEKYLDIGGIKLKKSTLCNRKYHVLSLVVSVIKPYKVKEENQETFSVANFETFRAMGLRNLFFCDRMRQHMGTAYTVISHVPEERIPRGMFC